MKKKCPASLSAEVDKDLSSDLVNTFHHAIWPFLVISQFMGILPVSGLHEKDVTRVHFKWIYVGIPVTMVLIGFGTIDLFLSLKIILERGLKMYTVDPVTLNLTCLLGLVAFFGLARDWPNLMRQFTNTEKVFLQKSYETKESRRFCSRLRLHGGILLFGAMVEHCMYVSSAIYNNYNQIKKCNLTVNFWENYFIRERVNLFTIIDFQLWMIPLSEWLTISKTFTWNFIDIFLMLITSSLALRFDQINKSIRRFTSVPLSDEFWLSARRDFMSLLDLLQVVDNHLSGLVLLSCANNLYFICFHVFQSFQQRGNTVDIIYFWYSLTFVLTRILTTMLSAASINDTANEILTAFYEIPIDIWGIEASMRDKFGHDQMLFCVLKQLKRFYEVVASDLIAVSGKRFFFITRRLIFAMAGTVVTYELVLLDQVKDVADLIDFCTSKRI